MIVVTVGNSSDIQSSHVPNKWLTNESIMPHEESTFGRKRKVHRGSGAKEFTSARTVTVYTKATVSTEALADKLDILMTEGLSASTTAKKDLMMMSLVENLKNSLYVSDEMKKNASVINESIITSLKDYLFDPTNYGEKFDEITTTIADFN